MDACLRALRRGKAAILERPPHFPGDLCLVVPVEHNTNRAVPIETATLDLSDAEPRLCGAISEPDSKPLSGPLRKFVWGHAASGMTSASLPSCRSKSALVKCQSMLSGRPHMVASKAKMRSANSACEAATAGREQAPAWASATSLSEKRGWYLGGRPPCQERRARGAGCIVGNGAPPSAASRARRVQRHDLGSPRRLSPSRSPL
jgi:hypothetical protein